MTATAAADVHSGRKTQLAALPWRRERGVVEVLLITSRETQRWVIPKGWPMRDLKPHEAAAQEAYEEAGILGSISKRALGAYRYEKRLKSGKIQLVRVKVYPLKVKEERLIWPEMAERERRWTPVAEAAGLVNEPELQALIKGFSPR